LWCQGRLLIYTNFVPCCQLFGSPRGFKFTWWP
jgi:hypothetical protein